MNEAGKIAKASIQMAILALKSRKAVQGIASKVFDPLGLFK
jgi:hypothetical protein